MLPLLLLAALPIAPVPAPSPAPADALASGAGLVAQAKPAAITAQTTTVAEAPTAESTAPKPTNGTDRSSRRYPYASLQLGVAIPNDYNGRIGALDTDTTLHLNTGFNGELGVGYKFNDIRSDLSVGYGNFAVNSQSYSTPGVGSATLDGQGAVNVWTVMANAYYDLPIWGDSDGNKLRFYLGGDTNTAGKRNPDTASAGADYTSAIEIWDPTANQDKGGWVAYVADSTYKVPADPERDPEREHASVVLVRVPINRDGISDNGETLTLTAVNAAGDHGSGSAVIRDDGSGTLFVTSAERSGVLAPTPVQLRRPQTSNSTTTADRANDSSLDPAVVDPALLPVEGEKRSRRRPVIRVSRPVVSEDSPYVVFSVYRDQLPSRWGPYLGGGIGYANLGTPACAAGDCYSGGNAGAFAWQAKLGLAYRATERGNVFLEGGYLGTTGRTSVDDVTFNNFGAWRVNLGWRQGF